MRLDPLETHTAVWRPVSDDQLADVVQRSAGKSAGVGEQSHE